PSVAMEHIRTAHDGALTLVLDNPPDFALQRQEAAFIVLRGTGPQPDAAPSEVNLVPAERGNLGASPARVVTEFGHRLEVVRQERQDVLKLPVLEEPFAWVRLARHRDVWLLLKQSTLEGKVEHPLQLRKFSSYRARRSSFFHALADVVTDLCGGDG